MPVDIHPKHKKPALELILCTLHAGGKFGNNDAYSRSGGLNGVGSSVVNALSRKLIATIRRDGFEWQQTFKRGKAAGGLEKLSSFRGHGTNIYFEPDPEIFKTTHFDGNLIKAHLEDMSYIHSGLKITFRNDVTKETFELSHPGGIPEFLQRLVTEGQKAAVTEQVFTASRDNGDKIEVAMQWTASTDETLRSYVNGIRTSSGGTHEAGFKAGVARAVRNYIETHDIKIKGWKSQRKISARASSASSRSLSRTLRGQTKEKIKNTELNAAVPASWARAQPG